MSLKSAPEPTRDGATIALVGLAHGTSHFHHLLLAPLFPVFMREFGLSYAELGLLVSIFFITSGIGQTLSGFLVDRVGARPVLFSALALFVAASLCVTQAQGAHGLMLAAFLAGLGNAPFHPVDFSILNQRVSSARLGHAFSVHGISGNLGWASAPVVLIGLSQALDHWRQAYAVVALATALITALLWWQRRHLQHAPAGLRASGPLASAAASEAPLAFLALPSVWLCFAFFFWTTAALSALQSFAGPALAQLHDRPVETTAFVVTGYMLAGALGMVIGGFVVNRVPRLDATIALAMGFSALLLALAASAWLPAGLAMTLTCLAGLGTGLAGPSRDMLIKQATPPGASGRVYGTVYAGLDLGFAAAAPVFGALMDRGHPQGVFWGAAVLILMGVLCAGAASRHRRPVPA